MGTEFSWCANRDPTKTGATYHIRVTLNTNGQGPTFDDAVKDVADQLRAVAATLEKGE